MMNMRSIILNILTILFLVFISTNAYCINYDCVNYTSAECINCAVKEYDTLWIGTSGGLVKIDLSNNESSFYNKCNSGLNFNVITSITIDRNGNKWIGGNGITKFKDGIWTDFPSAEIYSVKKIAIDTNDIVWVGTWTGLHKYENNLWTELTPNNSSIPGYAVFDIAIDTNNVKWFAMWGDGLVRFDDENWTVFDTSNSPLPNDNLQKLMFDQENNLWISNRTPNNLTRLSPYEIINESSWFNTPETGLCPGCTRNVEIEADDSNNILLSTENRIMIYKDSIWTFHSELEDSVHGGAVVMKFFNNNTKFLGNCNGGYYFSDNSIDFFDLNQSLLSDNEIQELYTDNQGEIYIGSSNTVTQYGLLKYNGVDWFEINYEGNEVESVVIDNTQKLWFGTHGSGMYSYDEGVISRYYYPQIPNNYISTIKCDNQNNIWAGGLFGGLIKIENDSVKIFDSSNSLLPSNRVNDIEIDDQIVWIVTDSGVVYLNQNELIDFSDALPGITDSKIREIEIDSEHNIWIVSDNRYLSKFDGKEWASFELGQFAGVVTDMGIDSKNNIWISSWAGFGVYNGSEFISFENTIKIGSVYSLTISKDNKIWLGTSGSGVFIFDIEDLLPKTNDTGTSNLIINQDYCDLEIFPNPANHVLNIKINSLKEGDIQIRLYNISGSFQKIINDKKVTFGLNQFLIPIEGIPNGTYICEIINNGQYQVGKLLIIKD